MHRLAILVLPSVLAFLPGCAWFLIGGAAAGIGLGLQNEEEQAPPPPALSLTAPRGGEFWGGTREIRWQTASPEPDTVEIEVSSDAGATWTVLAAGAPDSGTFDWDTTAQGDGASFRVRVRASDATGDLSPWSASEGDFVVDNTAPVVTLAAPLGGELWGGVRTVLWSTADANPARAAVEISTDSGATWTPTADLADGGLYAWDTAALGDGGTFRVRVAATDGAGNASSWDASAADFALDNTAPAATLTAPLGGELWSGSQAVRWVTADLNPGTAALEVSDDSGVSWAPLARIVDVGTFDWNTGNHGDGTGYRFRVRAVDGAGNVSSWSASASDFELDNTIPMATLTAPAAGQVWGGAHVVSWTTVETNPSTADLEISTNSGASWAPLVSAAADTGSYGWDTSAHADGPNYRVRVRVRDGAGNVSPWSATAGDFALDNNATVTLTAPLGGESWGGPRSVTWTTSDAHPATVDIEISNDGGGAWNALATAVPDNGAWAWNTVLQPAGDLYRIRVTARDALGNVSPASASAADFVLLHYAWTKRLGGASSEMVESVAVDASGNVFLLGSFRGTVNFAADWSGSDSKTSSGTSGDLFLTRVNADGSYGWTRCAGSSTWTYGKALSLDGAGNAFIAGYFDGTVNFQADWGGTDAKTAAGGNDSFVLKVLNDGSYGWVRHLTGPAGLTAYGAAADPAGNVYVTGVFQQTVNFAADWSLTDVRTSAGGWDAFLVKILSTGAYGWVRRVGSSGTEYGNAVALDGSGNVFFGGTYGGPTDFEADFGGSDPRPHSGLYDAYVTRVQSDGSYGWTRRIGGAGNETILSLSVAGTTLAATGSYEYAVDFRTDFGGGADVRTAAGGTDAFVLRMGTDASFGWVRSIGGAGNDVGEAVIADAASGVHVSGYFDAAVDFRLDFGGGADVRSCSGNDDAFLTRVRADGSYAWTRSFGGIGADTGRGVARDGAGNVYWAGTFQYTPNFRASFDSGTETKTSAGYQDAFLMKMR